MLHFHLGPLERMQASTFTHIPAHFGAPSVPVACHCPVLPVSSHRPHRYTQDKLLHQCGWLQLLPWCSIQAI